MASSPSGLRAAGYRVEVVRFGRRLGLLAGAAGCAECSVAAAPRSCTRTAPARRWSAALAGRRRRGALWLRVDRTLDGPVAALIASRCDRVVAISNNTLQGLGRRAANELRLSTPGSRTTRSIATPGARSPSLWSAARPTPR